MSHYHLFIAVVNGFRWYSTTKKPPTKKPPTKNGMVNKKTHNPTAVCPPPPSLKLTPYPKQIVNSLAKKPTKSETKVLKKNESEVFHSIFLQNHFDDLDLRKTIF